MGEQAGHVDRIDAWDSGDAYEPYVGRWSRLVAREFLGWLAVPPGRRWLDVGCGTGALAETILALAAPSKVVGIDPSPAYVAFARDRLSDPRVRFDVGDAQALEEASATFDAVVAGLVLNFVPEPEKALSEMVRVARPGGTVATYVWDYAEGMQLMRYFWDAAAALDPRARELDEGRRFRLCKPEPLTNLFQTSGLEKVEVRAIDVPTTFRSFDEYWSPFLGGQRPAPGYAMSLSQARRVALRERILAGLPTNSEGESITSSPAPGPHEVFAKDTLIFGKQARLSVPVQLLRILLLRCWVNKDKRKDTSPARTKDAGRITVPAASAPKLTRKGRVPARTSSEAPPPQATVGQGSLAPAAHRASHMLLLSSSYHPCRFPPHYHAPGCAVHQILGKNGGL